LSSRSKCLRGGSWAVAGLEALATVTPPRGGNVCYVTAACASGCGGKERGSSLGASGGVAGVVGGDAPVPGRGPGAAACRRDRAHGGRACRGVRRRLSLAQRYSRRPWFAIADRYRHVTLAQRPCSLLCLRRSLVTRAARVWLGACASPPLLPLLLSCLSSSPASPPLLPLLLSCLSSSPASSPLECASGAGCPRRRRLPHIAA